MPDSNQLQVPPAARNDRRSFELLRVWIANESQHISLRAGVWEDPAAWGMMLVDLAGHIANSYEQTEGLDRAEVLAKIREGFDAEWDAPTDEIAGEISS